MWHSHISPHFSFIIILSISHDLPTCLLAIVYTSILPAPYFLSSYLYMHMDVLNLIFVHIYVYKAIVFASSYRSICPPSHLIIHQAVYSFIYFCLSITLFSIYIA